MGKVRVYELAKEAEMESKDFTAKLIEMGYSVKSHSSSIDEEMAEEIRQKLDLVETTTERKRIQAKGKTTIIRRRTKVVRREETIPVELEDEATEEELLADEVSVAPVEEKQITPVAEKIEQGAAVVAEEKAVVIEDKTVVEPAKEEEVLSPPGERIVAEENPPTEESEAVMEEELEEVLAPKRKGFARVIKKAAIILPKEQEAVKPRKQEKPKGKVVKGKPTGTPVERGKAGQFEPGKQDDDSNRPKGKKGKRFVKFHTEPVSRDRFKKGPVGKRTARVEVEMEDVDAIGGRLPSGVRLGRGQRGGGKKNKHGDGLEVQETKAIKKRIKVLETISVGDLAHRMGVKASEIIANLMGLGIMATLNQSLDVDTATLLATDFGYEVEQGVTEEQSVLNLEDTEAGGEEVSRPPVITVMGHVDHGKTSILDAIRKTDVASGEAGGITQHIGAHYVRSGKGDLVFLDTPGHAAFTEMRSRGAKVTDIVVLVVAADDGVMDQTREAINHARAADVPIVVAINKIDKPNADPLRIKTALAEYDLSPEEWGGETIYCETSAKEKIGIEELLEQILLQAEMLELKADPKRKARGWVVEAQLHKGRGAVATILVQQGTLRVGDAFVVGENYGKVRSMHNDKGTVIDEAGPATPVEVHGLSGVPRAGDEFIVVSDEKMAKSVSAQRQLKSRESELAVSTKISLDNLFEHLKDNEVKELRVLLRADVQGTLEAFRSAIEKLSTDEIRVKILHQGTGAIIESDVLLASASDAFIFGFNVRPSTKVQEQADNEHVDIRYYDVIYHALDDITKAMTGMLDSTFVEKVIGSVEVRDIFHHPKAGTIAGCYVVDGMVDRHAKVRLLRDGVVVYTGKISSLRRFKDDVKEVLTGFECGIGLENFNDVKVGDVLEIFRVEEVAGVL
ncbi:MAG: translation initiation factor IF-2 [Proteobacteria bacterium]|nr:translation initiation factor IF-2 [Pseudomonadota bacterium]MBU1716197.1 translation initiation factor IF-2 [Pseudomonadota bacterium]